MIGSTISEARAVSVDLDAFRNAMQALVGHVTILTARDDTGNPIGITATAVCSLTAEPPAILACINRSTWLGSAVRDIGTFGVNILASDQVRQAQVFAGMDSSLLGVTRFIEGSWSNGSNGSPLLDGALASFDCVLDHVVERSTHVVAFGLISDARFRGDSAEPLLYHRRMFQTVGDLS